MRIITLLALIVFAIFAPYIVFCFIIWLFGSSDIVAVIREPVYQVSYIAVFILCVVIEQIMIARK